MALVRIVRYCSKSPVVLNFSGYVCFLAQVFRRKRSIKPTPYLLMRCWYRSSSLKLSIKETPVKYTTSKASKQLARESVKDTLDKDVPYRKFIIIASVSIFLIYFCILREENDIDEILKGNDEFVSDAVKLNNLKLKLIYCKTNNLPTEKLEAKIEEYQKKLGQK